MAESDRLSEIWRLQFEQQEHINGPLPEGRAEQRALATAMATYLNGETYTYLDHIAYKAFLPLDEAPRTTRILDLVDIVKYAIALAWTEGVTAREFHEAFVSKTKTVTQRFNESLLRSKVAGFDIDGVLCEYGEWLPNEHEFIEGGGCVNLSPMVLARHTLEQLKQQGWSIVIVTARKAHIHQRLERDTHEWFQRNRIPYDRILFGYDKMEHIKPFGEQFKFFVEDSPKHALDVADGGIPVFYLNDGGRGIIHDNIYSIKSLDEIWEKLKQIR